MTWCNRRSLSPTANSRVSTISSPPRDPWPLTLARSFWNLRYAPEVLGWSTVRSLIEPDRRRTAEDSIRLESEMTPAQNLTRHTPGLTLRSNGQRWIGYRCANTKMSGSQLVLVCFCKAPKPYPNDLTWGIQSEKNNTSFFERQKCMYKSPLSPRRSAIAT